jgi:hypothetical protein
VPAGRSSGLHERYNATEACWQRCGELPACHLTGVDTPFIHQRVTDVSGARHSGGITRNITTAFSLTGRYLTLEKGCSGWQVQQAYPE